MTAVTAFWLTPIAAFVSVWVVRNDARMTLRHPLLTPAALAFLSFAGLLWVPINAFFYLFHPDWFLHYFVDTANVPSAIALLGFVGLFVFAALSFLGASMLMRNQRDAYLYIGLGVLVAMLIGSSFALQHRIAHVGTFTQYHRNFALNSTFHTPQMIGVLVVATIVLACGYGYLLRKQNQMIKAS